MLSDPYGPCAAMVVAALRNLVHAGCLDWGTVLKVVRKNVLGGSPWGDTGTLAGLDPVLGRSVAMLLGDGECTASDDDASSDDDDDSADQGPSPALVSAVDDLRSLLERDGVPPGVRDAASLAGYSCRSLGLGDAPAYTAAGPPPPSHARFAAVSRRTLSPAAPRRAAADGHQGVLAHHLDAGQRGTSPAGEG